MCGIFGAVFVQVGQSVDAQAALRSLHHRGPDDAGVFTAPGVVLGHTRLAILDLTPAAAQPMASEDGRIVVVFNGEIYNHHELRRELSARGHVFRSRSDTEVIVEGYRAWGHEVIERLDGMFAIGLMDLGKRQLLLARDRAGKKPLFYAMDGGTIRFASEVKAILASGVMGEMDASALPSLLVLGYTPAPRTMYRSVTQLPPASTLVLQEGQVPVVRRYWQAPFDAVPLRCSAEEATREVRRLVEQAVQRRLEADVPLGAFLSGGVDSTIIVGVTARLTGRRVKTFSIGFAGDARFDETHYARIVARKFDTEHTEFIVEPSSFDLVERLVALHDGPFGDSSAIPTSIVSMLTRQHVTVALTGDGGDELFCGYTRFLAAEAAERIPVSARRAGAALARLLPTGPGERTLLARANRFLGVATLPLADRMTSWNAYFTGSRADVLRPDLRTSLPSIEPFEWTRMLFANQRYSTTLARVLAHNFESYLPYDLLVKADRASMAHSLEVRSPFLDTALIEYAARLPDHFKRRGTFTKWILKRAFRDVLPRAIVTRSKMGFGMPLGTWFRTSLRDYLLDHLAPGAQMYQYLDRACVEALARDHFTGRADHGHRLWLLLTLEVWLRSLQAAHAPPAAAA
jgi:asparagine synthase (glutamine-hydrolysing)